MLITEKKLRRVIRDLLREQIRSDVRSMKKHAKEKEKDAGKEKEVDMTMEEIVKAFAKKENWSKEDLSYNLKELRRQKIRNKPPKDVWSDLGADQRDMVKKICPDCVSPQSASVVDDEETEDTFSDENLAAASAEEKAKRGKVGEPFDIGEDWTYVITDDDNKKIAQTSVLNFTVHDGPSNKGKSFQLKDKTHSMYDKVKELFPHLKQWI